MNSMPSREALSISIAMATYNGARYLQAQLDSFLEQTRQPDELVVCDDGSTDSTIDILERFQQDAPFTVKIHRNEMNLGFTKNFEKALLKCSSDVVFLSDQDDIWFSTKVEVVMKAFLANPGKLLVVHDGNLVGEKLDWHGATMLGQVKSGYRASDSLVTGALTAMRAEFFSYALPIPTGVVGHDVWLHNIARHLDARLVLDQLLQTIRRHSSNTSHWIASSIHRIGRFEVILSQWRTSVASGYEDRILINKSSFERLMLISGQGSMFFQDAIDRSLTYLTSERRALMYRSGIPGAAPLKRKIMSIHLLLHGGYRFFNGYKSFLRDMFR